MTKSVPKNSKPNFFTPVRSWLLASTVVSGAFTIFVSLATSLGFYAIPIGTIAIISLVVLLTPRAPRWVLYPVLALSILGSLVAIFLTLSFANYYQQYVEYQQHLNK